jgi:hypothetical protein
MMVSGAQGTPFTCTQASSLALSYHLNSLFYAALSLCLHDGKQVCSLYPLSFAARLQG